MKKYFFLILCLAASTASYSQDYQDGVNDTLAVTSLDEIINNESKLQSGKDIESRYKKIWKKQSFLNIGLNTTTFSSSEFPTEGGTYSDEFKNKFGISVQSGKTYYLHKKPLGEILFIGLDLSFFDVSFNTYEAESPSQAYKAGNDTPYSLPWHNKKWTLDYRISAGPSLTFYPFTPLGNSATDKIRVHTYFHIGYSVGLASINDVAIKNSKEENQMAWGHGLNTKFGISLSWDFIGIGYEAISASSLKYQPIGKDFKTGDIKAKRTVNNIFLQFRL